VLLAMIALDGVRAPVTGTAARTCCHHHQVHHHHHHASWRFGRRVECGAADSGEVGSTCSLPLVGVNDRLGVQIASF
jgi:hypothetical protein